MRVALFPGLFLFLCSACTSPQRQLRQLEGDMLALLGPTTGWKVPTRSGAIWLPLPPPTEVQAEQQTQAQQLLASAAKIDSVALTPEQRAALRQYRQALADLANASAGWPLDPMTYTLAGPFQRCLAETDGESLTLLLEKMPDYYTEVEQRWRSTHRHHHAPAVEQCMVTLDTLKGLEQNLEKYPLGLQARLRGALPPAQMGLKNYLGQCRSLVLE